MNSLPLLPVLSAEQALWAAKGTVAGAVVGALVMGSLNNGMDLLGWTNSKQMIVQGLVLIIAVYVDVVSKNKK